MDSGRALPEVRILPATTDMLSEILSVEESCFSSPWTRKMLEAELTGNPFAHFLVAMAYERSTASAESAILGYHCFWIVFEELRLMNLAVRASMRRQGIGKVLVKEACRLGSEQSATRAVLEVRASNEPALSLYASIGFIQVGRRPQYYTNPAEDALLMELNPLVVSDARPSERVRCSGGTPTLPDSF